MPEKTTPETKPSLAIDRLAGNGTDSTTVEPTDEGTSPPDPEEEDEEENEEDEEEEGKDKEVTVPKTDENEEERQTTLKVGKFPSRTTTPLPPVGSRTMRVSLLPLAPS